MLTEKQREQFARIWADKMVEAFDWDAPIPQWYMDWMAQKDELKRRIENGEEDE